MTPPWPPQTPMTPMANNFWSDFSPNILQIDPRHDYLRQILCILPRGSAPGPPSPVKVVWGTSLGRSRQSADPTTDLFRPQFMEVKMPVYHQLREKIMLGDVQCRSPIYHYTTQNWSKRSKKTRSRQWIPEAPNTLGHWLKWIWTLHMVGLRGKMKPSRARKVAHWTSASPKYALLVKTVQKNKEPSKDSRGPKHFWALVEVVLDSLYGWSTDKIEAESSPEGCPLNFGPPKVPTFWFFWSQHVPNKIFSVFPKVLSLMSYT